MVLLMPSQNFKTDRTHHAPNLLACFRREMCGRAKKYEGE